MAASKAPRLTKTPEIRKGDTVVVLAGKDAGKRGVVEHVRRNARGKMLGSRSRVRPGAAPLSDATVVVAGLNIAKRHTKPRQSSSATDRAPRIQQGGILEIAQPIALSKVMLVCARCEQPTRVAHATLDNGRRVRVCRHCGEQLEVKA